MRSRGLAFFSGDRAMQSIAFLSFCAGFVGPAQVLRIAGLAG